VTQVLRYGLVGLTSNALAFGVYALITRIGTPPTVAMTIVYLCAAIFSFFANRRLTFAHEGNVWGAASRFVIAYAVGYLIDLGILVVLVDRMGYSHLWVQAGAVLVVAAYLFVTLKLVVFAPRRTTPPAGNLRRGINETVPEVQPSAELDRLHL
jgi:putative flippase GtrA